MVLSGTYILIYTTLLFIQYVTSYVNQIGCATNTKTKCNNAYQSQNPSLIIQRIINLISDNEINDQ